MKKDNGFTEYDFHYLLNQYKDYSNIIQIGFLTKEGFLSNKDFITNSNIYIIGEISCSNNNLEMSNQNFYLFF